MRCIIDENVPASVAAFLAERGHEIIDIRHVLGSGADDDEIARFGDDRAEVVVTWDKDFKQIIRRAATGRKSQFQRLGRISFDCDARIARRRLTDLMEIIEFAYAIGQNQRDVRLIVEISETTLRIIR